MNTVISVFLNKGEVLSYRVENPEKGREHAAAILDKGYRHYFKKTGDLEMYPPSSINKVRVTSKQRFDSRYASREK